MGDLLTQLVEWSVVRDCLPHRLQFARSDRLAYLYGDSSPSQLETNYIELLRDILDFAVQILVVDHRVNQLHESGAAHKQTAERELERLKVLSQTITKTLDGADAPERTTTGQCVVGIRNAASTAIKNAANQVKTELNREMDRIQTRATAERASNLKALEKLLLGHDLPGTVHRLTIEAIEGGYQARLSGQSKLQVQWMMSLGIPDSSLFAHPIRVSGVGEFEIKVPVKSGLVRKSMKLRTQKFSKEFVTELVQDRASSVIKLRDQFSGDDNGYDIFISAGSPRVKIIRHKAGEEAPEEFAPREEDEDKLLTFHKALLDDARELMGNRNAILQARLDNTAFQDHDKPSTLVNRLIQSIAPIIQEIGKRSLSPNEFVLKRVLADNRREEIFVSKTDLLKKIEPVPLELRGIFAPLGLGDLAQGKDVAKPAGSSAPADGSGGAPGSAPAGGGGGAPGSSEPGGGGAPGPQASSPPSVGAATAMLVAPDLAAPPKPEPAGPPGIEAGAGLIKLPPPSALPVRGDGSIDDVLIDMSEDEDDDFPPGVDDPGAGFKKDQETREVSLQDAARSLLDEEEEMTNVALKTPKGPKTAPQGSVSPPGAKSGPHIVRNPTPKPMQRLGIPTGLAPGAILEEEEVTRVGESSEIIRQQLNRATTTPSEAPKTDDKKIDAALAELENDTEI